MKLSMRRPRMRGFTLMELLAAAVIVGILASVAVPVVQTSMRREKERVLRQALRDIRNAIDTYKQAVIAGKIDLPDGASGYPATLLELAAGVPVKGHPNDPKLYFLRRIPRDPFADPGIAAVDTWAQRSYASSSEAPQPGADVFDVASLSPQTGMNGVPYAQW